MSRCAKRSEEKWNESCSKSSWPAFLEVFGRATAVNLFRACSVQYAAWRYNNATEKEVADLEKAQWKSEMAQQKRELEQEKDHWKQEMVQQMQEMSVHKMKQKLEVTQMVQTHEQVSSLNY